MNEEKRKFDQILDGEEMAEMLEALIDKIERGEISSVALRVFNVDGTHEDIAVGNSEEEKAATLTALRRRLGDLH